jgi:hemolysin III
LIITWGRWPFFFVSLIYGIAAVSLFLSSALYHARKKRENEVNIYRKLDHIAIFIMIAGSYTPISYIYLSGAWRWIMIILPWAFVIIGMVLKLVYLKAPRIISPILYLVMGWLAVIPLWLLWQSMPLSVFILLLSGGIAYSVGAVIYAIKRPNPFPGVFGFHDIFHLLILLGAVLHYATVLLAIIPG